jgi:phage repressor protein C with HTH and peptisase S24 domain
VVAREILLVEEKYIVYRKFMSNEPDDLRRPRLRLAKLARERGSSMAALSKMIGKNASYLNQYMGKFSPRKLDEEDRRKLAQFFGVAESELGGPEETSYESRSQSPGDWVEIPRLPLEASAGPGAVGAAEIPFDAFRFSRRWLREQGLEPAMLSSIRVMGDSMDPLLRDGDEILVDRTPRPFREGVHVVRLGEALHVKLLQAVPPGGMRLISKNAAYEPVEVAMADVDVVGRVVWKGGRL